MPSNWRSLAAMNCSFKRSHDDNEQAWHRTHRQAWVMATASADSLRRATASAGTAFKAPTFNQLYHPSFGNRKSPRKLAQFRAGPGRYQGWAVGQSRCTVNEIDDLIAYFKPGAALARAEYRQAVINGHRSFRWPARVMGWI